MVDNVFPSLISFNTVAVLSKHTVPFSAKYSITAALINGIFTIRPDKYLVRNNKKNRKKEGNSYLALAEFLRYHFSFYKCNIYRKEACLCQLLTKISLVSLPNCWLSQINMNQEGSALVLWSSSRRREMGGEVIYSLGQSSSSCFLLIKASVIKARYLKIRNYSTSMLPVHIFLLPLQPKI